MAAYGAIKCRPDIHFAYYTLILSSKHVFTDIIYYHIQFNGLLIPVNNSLNKLVVHGITICTYEML